MAEREERDDDLNEEREEGRRTEAPTGEGHVDSEPEDEVIPHSAKAYSDYHTGLKDLTHAAAHHHGEFLKEMKKHHGAMEHMTLKNHFGRMLEDHEKSLNDMLDSHNHILDQVKRKFAKYHPDLEPLDKDLDEEDDLPTGDKPTKEPRQSRSDRGELGHEDTKTLPQKEEETPARVAPVAPVAEKKAPPAETKVVADGDLSEEEAALFLSMVGQIRKEAKDLRREVERSVG